MTYDNVGGFDPVTFQLGLEELEIIVTVERLWYIIYYKKVMWFILLYKKYTASNSRGVSFLRVVLSFFCLTFLWYDEFYRDLGTLLFLFSPSLQGNHCPPYVCSLVHLRRSYLSLK